MNNKQTERILHHFEEMNKIPRCSGNEKEVSNFLKNFAEKLGLEVIQDSNLNIIIKKPGTKGYENSPVVILQGHMDMVCEKTSDSNHDFSKDPVELIKEGNFIKGNNTTIGADNGLAVAISMAILENEDIVHPPLEILITVEEETTMKGALNLDSNILSGEMLINLDSDEEGVLTVGSAGGVSTVFSKKIIREENTWNSFKIKFEGLKGGHSGVEIDKNFGNMIKVIGEFLSILKEKSQFRIGKFNSGTVHNAIPRSGEIEISIEDSPAENLETTIKETRDRFKDLDGDLEIKYESTDLEKVWSKDLTFDFINLISSLPTGVNSYVQNENIVESSSNLAIAEEKEDEIYIEVSIRSSNDSKKENIIEKSTDICKENNFSYKLDSGYPTWEYKKESKLREIAKNVYKELFNKEMEVLIIHAGLECGAISSKYPNMDIISIGSNIHDIHTPKERLDIDSLERIYKFILNILKEIK